MAKLKFKDENGVFIPVVQNVKVNNSSVFDGKNANIRIKTINGQSIIGNGNLDINSVEYDTDQSLTAQQKATARNNISAVGQDQVKQQTGSSTTDTMSQKSISDELANKQDRKPNGRDTLIASNTGKLNLAYMPLSIQGGIVNGGTFDEYGNINASSYAPELNGQNIQYISTSEYTSYYFIYVGHDGVDILSYNFYHGDWAISLGSGWTKLDANDAVTSVNGQTGEVYLTAESIEATPSSWGYDNRNKNLVTDSEGNVTLSDFSLGQIIVRNYNSLPNMPDGSQYQDLPIGTKAMVQETIDVYPSITIDDIMNSIDYGVPLPYNNITIFDPEERPFDNNIYLYLHDSSNSLNLYYNNSYTSDPVFYAEFIDPNTGYETKVIYSWISQAYNPYRDSSIYLQANGWTKIYYNTDSQQYEFEYCDNNSIIQLRGSIYATQSNALDNNFLHGVTSDVTKYAGEYVYLEADPHTDPPTYYWKYTPSNVNADWITQDESSPAYIYNKPKVLSIYEVNEDNINQEVLSYIAEHKPDVLKVTANYGALQNYLKGEDNWYSCIISKTLVVLNLVESNGEYNFDIYRYELDNIKEVSGKSIGSYWTELTIGNTTHAIATGGGSGNVDDVRVNNVSVVDGNKVANITVPTDNNQLTNGADYQVRPILVDNSSSSSITPTFEGETYLNTSDKKIYTASLIDYALAQYAVNDVSIDFYTGVASGFSDNYGVYRAGTTLLWKDDITVDLHFKLINEPSSQYLTICYLYTGSSDSKEVCFYLNDKKISLATLYSNSGPSITDTDTILADYTLSANTEYYVRINKIGTSVNTTISTTDYDVNVLYAETTSTSDWYISGETTSTIYYCRYDRGLINGHFIEEFPGEIYLADSFGGILVPNTYSWDNGVSISDTLQYLDDTNKLLYLYRDNKLFTYSEHDSTKEDISNKVTSLSASSTDTEYPSAKCVYDMVGNIEATLQAIRGV